MPRTYGHPGVDPHGGRLNAVAASKTSQRAKFGESPTGERQALWSCTFRSALGQQGTEERSLGDQVF